MRISTIALANLRRRKGKAAFLVAGIAIGIGTAVALFTLSGSIRDEIGSQMDRFGANIVILPHVNTVSLDYGGVAVSGVSYDVHQLRDADAAAVLTIPYRKRLSVVAPKLLTKLAVNGQESLVVGVDFARELRLKRWWQIGGERPAQANDVLVGYEVARGLGLMSVESRSDNTAHHTVTQEQIKPAKTDITIAGRRYRLSGIIHQTGGPEDRAVFMGLPEAQRLSGRAGELSLIEVSALCKDCPVEDIVAQINKQLPNARASAIQQAVKARTETVERLTRFSAAVSAVVLAIGGLMIFTTMMGSVVERTREIGVLRAVGFRRQHIASVLLIEITIISILGGLLGALSGVAVSEAALPYFAEAGAKLSHDWSLAALALLGALVIGLVSSAYPTLRASRLDPCEAVRYV